jgi:hypothetical protein
LDQIKLIHERWDIFFQWFQLLQLVNQVYIQQCNQYLSSMNLDENKYRSLIKHCQNQMRMDAESETTNKYKSN